MNRSAREVMCKAL